MERPRNPTREYVAELLWAAFMFNLMMGLVGLLIGAQFGSLFLGLALFLGGGLLISAVLALLVLCNAVVVWLIERRRALVLAAAMVSLQACSQPASDAPGPALQPTSAPLESVLIRGGTVVRREASDERLDLLLQRHRGYLVLTAAAPNGGYPAGATDASGLIRGARITRYAWTPVPPDSLRVLFGVPFMWSIFRGSRVDGGYLGEIAILAHDGFSVRAPARLHRIECAEDDPA